ncbi:MAG: NusG domain II-containing protein [Clostridia bacterium]|nr:NusG domain II-containing protein [Clostridia bacterium]MBR3809548.1 NusG domain II-containing protein [Clostridia bacterium]
MNNKRKIKNDVILAVIVIAIAATGLLLLNVFKTEGAFAVVKLDGKETERYPLSVNTEVVIETENDGKNTLVIEDGKAFIKDATCPDKICEGHSKISFKGETIVCLPHKVVIEIVADDSDKELDVVV